MAKIYMKAPNGEVFETSNPEWHQECVRLSAKDGPKERKAYVAKQLRKLVKPGDTVHTILRHVSASGMSRRISLVIVAKDHNGKLAPRNIDTMAANLMGYQVDASGGIRVGGCGMDMGFHLVYTLGYYLWPKGTRKPHGTRNGEPDTDGGYALKHSWL